jgi:hypothetical protein
MIFLFLTKPFPPLVINITIVIVTFPWFVTEPFQNTGINAKIQEHYKAVKTLDLPA